MPTEKRRDLRNGLNAKGSITWHKPDGSRIFEAVTILDLSEHGARFECTSKLLARQFIRVEVPSEKVDGMASVRRCDGKGLKFQVGVEFINAREIRPKSSRWT